MRRMGPGRHLAKTAPGDSARFSVYWSLAERFSSKLLGLVVFTMLSRLLQPLDFGLVAVCAILIALLQTLTSQGVAKAVIRDPELTAEATSTAFWLAVSIGVMLTASTALLAEPLAALLGDPAAAGLLRALSATFAISAIGSVPLALLQREMRFKAIAQRNTAAALVGGTLGIALAIAGAGAWSLVAQMLATEFVGLLTVLLLSRWRPTRVWDPVAASRLLKFGAGVTLVGLLDAVTSNSDNLVAAHVLGTTALGAYAVGYRLLSVSLDLTVQGLLAVTLPLFSRIVREKRAPDALFLSVSKIAVLFSIPFFGILAFEADRIVPLIFGAQWSRSALVFIALCPGAILLTASFLDRSLLLALGHTSPVIWLTLAKALVSLPCFVIGAHLGGVTGLAWAWSAATAVMWPVRVTVVVRYTSLTVWRYFAQYWGLAVAGALQALSHWGLAQALPDTANATLSALPGVSALVVYCVSVWLLDRSLLVDAFRRVTGRSASGFGR